MYNKMTQSLQDTQSSQNSQNSQSDELKVYSTFQLQKKLMSLGIKMHPNTILYYIKKGIIVPDYVLLKDKERVSRYRFSEENVQRIIEKFRNGYSKNKNFVLQKENQEQNTKTHTNTKSIVDDFFALFEQ